MRDLHDEMYNKIRTPVATVVTASWASIAESGSWSAPRSAFHTLTRESAPPVYMRLILIMVWWGTQMRRQQWLTSRLGQMLCMCFLEDELSWLEARWACLVPMFVWWVVSSLVLSWRLRTRRDSPSRLTLHKRAHVTHPITAARHLLPLATLIIILQKHRNNLQVVIAHSTASTIYGRLLQLPVFLRRGISYWKPSYTHCHPVSDLSVDPCQSFMDYKTCVQLLDSW